MENIIKKYIGQNNQKFQRYNSWNHCYEAFGNNELNNTTLALHLGFYLASWGMYRGSSKLLDRDYLVHIEAVKIIKKYHQLRCAKEHEVSLSDASSIQKLITELSIYYKDEHDVTPTDTLISKIILGTLGCLPAFDRFFVDGVKEHEFKFKSLKEKSLIQLFKFVNHNLPELNHIKNDHPEYSIMKIVDMYFWQIGFDLSTKKTKNGKTKLL